MDPYSVLFDYTASPAYMQNLACALSLQQSPRWTTGATDPNVRYGGIFLITIGAFPGGPGFLAWAANNAAGPAVRSVSTAYVVTLGTAGGILATWYVKLQSSYD